MSDSCIPLLFPPIYNHNLELTRASMNTMYAYKGKEDPRKAVGKEGRVGGKRR